MFNRPKHFRRIATRYDKTAKSFLGLLCLAAARLWLPSFVNRPYPPGKSSAVHDSPELIHQWSGLDTSVYRFYDRQNGVIGKFTEVYVCFEIGTS